MMVGQMLRPAGRVDDVDGVRIDAEVAIDSRDDFTLVDGTLSRDLAGDDSWR